MAGDHTIKKRFLDQTFRFGDVPLDDGVEALRRELNQEMIRFLRSLPPATHTDAIIFFMQHFKTAFVPEFDYFRNYYAPAWSILYWIGRESSLGPTITREDYHHAKTAHAMALFLHPLDDHLNDGQLSATHLTLLLRSQAWMLMNIALKPLADGVEGGKTVVSDFLNEYYASIGTHPHIDSLDGYCTHFRKQMATGMIAPTLLVLKRSAADRVTEDLQRAYGAFGVAWRLLDDLQDITSDRMSGSRSAVYYGLDGHQRREWDLARVKVHERRAALSPVGEIWEINSVLDTIRARIIQELELAANLVTQFGMNGLAAEFAALVRPLADRPALT